MDEMSLPLGWDSVLVAGEGDQAIIENTYINGVKCAGFIIHEDGIQYEEYNSTHAGIIQKILFPETEIKALVFPTANTLTTGRVVIGPGIHFMDDFGHALVIGFSDEVDGEEVFPYADGNRILVVKEAQLNQWSECSIDLSAYWGQTNWWQPKEIDMMPLVSTYYTDPGYYTFYVASIETADARTGAAGP